MNTYPANTPDIHAMAPDDAAAHWLLARDHGADLDQDKDFRTWLTKSANSHAWESALAGWNAFEVPDPLLDELRRDALAARPERRSIGWMAIAAGIAVLSIAGGVGWLRTHSTSAPAPAVLADAGSTFATGASPVSFALADGSQVMLNANSVVSVRYSAKARSVRLLKGEAYFDVQHDPAHPFTVRALGNVVNDIGTKFDVASDGKAVSVILAEGSVAIDTATTKGKILTPGQKIEIQPEVPDHVSNVILAEVLSWRQGYIEFHDEPLENVVTQINRYGGAPVRIIDPAIRAKRISGRFRTGDPSRFARSLAATYGLRIVKRPDGGVDLAGQ